MNESLSAIWPVVSGVMIVPVVAWIKTKLPVDFPLTAPFFSAVISLVVMYALAQGLVPDMPWQDIITFTLGSMAVAQGTHATTKTVKKLNGGAPK